MTFNFMTMKGIYKWIMLIAVALLLPNTAAAQKKQKAEEVQRVWAFGFAENLNDTLVYLSPVQELVGAELEKNTEFLMFREDYALQMKQKMENTYPGGYVCSVIYAKSKEKAEKKYLKVRREQRRRYQTLLIELTKEEFLFKARQ